MIKKERKELLAVFAAAIALGVVADATIEPRGLGWLMADSNDCVQVNPERATASEFQNCIVEGPRK